MPAIETTLNHDIAAVQIEFKSFVFLRDDYLVGAVKIELTANSHPN
jgi:hypothetical protein